MCYLKMIFGHRSLQCRGAWKNVLCKLRVSYQQLFKKPKKGFDKTSFVEIYILILKSTRKGLLLVKKRFGFMLNVINCRYFVMCSLGPILNAMVFENKNFK